MDRASRKGRRRSSCTRTAGANAVRSPFRHIEADGTGAFYWIEGDFGYALIGDLARDPLLRAARAVYSEFRALPAAD